MALGLSPSILYTAYVGFVAFQIINVLVFFTGCFESFNPKLSRFWLFMLMAAAAVIFVTMLARSLVKQPASFVFVGFTNFTGWPNGTALFTGLLAVNWGFSCLDVVTHMAEEIQDPRQYLST